MGNRANAGSTGVAILPVRTLPLLPLDVFRQYWQ